jgi:hypothetical protein
MAAIEYRKVILAALAETLGPDGFRKSGPVFKRSREDVVHLLSLQSSTESTADSLRVTLNLAIWAESLAAERTKPEVAASQWNERIGFLLPVRQDRWWIARSDAEARSVAAEICAAVVKYGLPALDAISSTADLALLWESNRSPGLTAIQAQRYLARLREQTAEANKRTTGDAGTGPLCI